MIEASGLGGFVASELPQHLDPSIRPDEPDSVHEDERAWSAGMPERELHRDASPQRAAEKHRVSDPDAVAQLVYGVGPRVECPVRFGTSIAAAVADEVDIDELRVSRSGDNQGLKNEWSTSAP